MIRILNLASGPSGPRCRPLLLLFAVVCFSPLFGGEEKRSLEEALKRLPSAERHYEQGLAEFRAERYGKAAAAFEKCLGELPRHAYAHYYLANLFYIEGDNAKAQGHMEEALGNLAFMRELNDYAVDRKKLRIESYEKMLETEWESTNSCRTSRELESLAGELSDRKSRLELEAERRQAALTQQRAHYLYFLGNILFRLGLHPEAADKYRQAIALNPRHANAYNNAAALSYMAGDQAAALAFLERAERQGLEDNLNLKLQYLVCEALGRPTEGILQEDLSPGADAGLGVIRFALAYKSDDALLPPLYENCYVVFSRASRQAVIIDPGAVDPRIADLIAQESLDVRAILNTHNHLDHTAANAYYAKRFGAPVLIHGRDAGFLDPPPDQRLEDGEELRYDGLAFEVHHTPGHTLGSVCFLIEGYLFSGDTLFRHDIGSVRTEDPRKAGAAQDELIRSIKDRFLSLADETRVCPGHMKTSTIAEEKANNPFLKK